MPRGGGSTNLSSSKYTKAESPLEPFQLPFVYARDFPGQPLEFALKSGISMGPPRCEQVLFWVAKRFY